MYQPRNIQKSLSYKDNEHNLGINWGSSIYFFLQMKTIGLLNYLRIKIFETSISDIRKIFISGIRIYYYYYY